MKRTTLLLVIASTLVASGCGDSAFFDWSCESEMSDVRARLGPPEEVRTYNSRDYQNTDWYYWTRGISYTFTYFQGCSVSYQTFPPIR
jgi:hypothetical protein